MLMPTPKSVGELTSCPLTWGSVWKTLCVYAQPLSRIWLFVTPCAVQTTILLRPWDFPGKNTGVDCPFLHEGISPTQGTNPHILQLQHRQANSWPLSHLGTPPQNTTLDKLVFLSFACHIIDVVFLWAVSNLSGCVHIYKSNYSRLVHPAYPTSANLMGGGRNGSHIHPQRRTGKIERERRPKTKREGLMFTRWKHVTGLCEALCTHYLMSPSKQYSRDCPHFTDEARKQRN